MVLIFFAFLTILLVGDWLDALSIFNGKEGDCEVEQYKLY